VLRLERNLHPRSAYGLRILVAEDNLNNQKVAVSLLAKQGHSVVVVADGREAIDAIERESFDLVLMDIQMPDMDGFEATQRIRERERITNTRIPIIAMTAHAMSGDREKCLAAGMEAYISKPIRWRELVEVIASVTATTRPVNTFSGDTGDTSEQHAAETPRLSGQISDGEPDEVRRG